MNTCFERRSDSILTQPVGAELLVYDERRHTALCFNPASAAVWNALGTTASLDQIAMRAGQALGQPLSAACVQSALAQFRTHGLLHTEGEATTREDAAAHEGMPGTAVLSRRGMLTGMGAASALLVPAVAVIAAPRAAQAYGGGGCVPAETPVLLPGGGMRPIGAVRRGDTVAATDTRTGQIVPATVREVHRVRTTTLHRLSTASGDTLLASPSHRFVDARARHLHREAWSLRPGDRLLVYHPGQGRLVETALVENDELPSESDVYHLSPEERERAILIARHPSVTKF